MWRNKSGKFSIWACMGSEEVENVKSLHRTDGQTNAAHFTIRKAQLVQETSVNLIEENLSNVCLKAK